MFSTNSKRLLQYPVLKYAALNNTQQYLIRRFTLNCADIKEKSNTAKISSAKNKENKPFKDQVFYPLLRLNQFTSCPKIINYQKGMIISSNLILMGMSLFNEFPISYSIFLSTFFYASSKALFASTQITEKFFSKPKNAIQFTAFNQATFRSLVNAHMNNLLRRRGYCMGHVMMWYQHQRIGENYIKKLNELSTKLTEQGLDIEELLLINNFVEFQERRVMEHVKKHSSNPDSLLNNSRQEHISRILDKSRENPDKLFVLIVSNNNVSHAIGIMTKNNQILYFDPNRGEFTFNDTLPAKISLSRYLAYTYGNTHPELSRYPVSFFWGKESNSSFLFIEDLALEPRTVEEERHPVTIDINAASQRNYLRFP